MCRRFGISTQAISERGAMPIEIVLDNGSELTSRALGQWAYWRSVRLRFIDPGKPVQVTYIESFARESSA